MSHSSFQRIAPLAVLVGSFALPVHAADTFFDFESGNLDSWLDATTGGNGSTGVEEHNSSQMAFVQHTGNVTHSLSRDFAYVAGDEISFDMHAVANPSLLSTHSFSGVMLSFLNSFNVSLGSVALFNTTNPASLTAHQFSVDKLQHSYGETMASWATAAGVGTGTSIAKGAISFAVSAQSACCSGPSFTTYSSNAKVWFDNVSVSAVPEPSQWALMIAGLLATAGFAGRGRKG